MDKTMKKYLWMVITIVGFTSCSKDYLNPTLTVSDEQIFSPYPLLKQLCATAGSYTNTPRLHHVRRDG